MGQAMSDSAPVPQNTGDMPGSLATDHTVDEADAPDPELDDQQLDPTPTGRVTRWPPMPVGPPVSPFHANAFLQSPFLNRDHTKAAPGQDPANIQAMQPFMCYGSNFTTLPKRSWSGYSIVNFTSDTGNQAVVTQRLIRSPRPRSKRQSQTYHGLFLGRQSSSQPKASDSSFDTQHQQCESASLHDTRQESTQSDSIYTDTVDKDVKDLVVMMKAHQITKYCDPTDNTASTAKHAPPPSPIPLTSNFKLGESNLPSDTPPVIPSTTSSASAPSFGFIPSSHFEFSFSANRHVPNPDPPKIQNQNTAQPVPAMLSNTTSATHATQCHVSATEKIQRNQTHHGLPRATTGKTENDTPDGTCENSMQHNEDSLSGDPSERLGEHGISANNNPRAYLQHRKILPLPNPRWKWKGTARQSEGSESKERVLPHAISNDKHDAETRSEPSASWSTLHHVSMQQHNVAGSEKNDLFSATQERSATESVDTHERDNSKKFKRVAVNEANTETLGHHNRVGSKWKESKWKNTSNATSPDNTAFPSGAFNFAFGAETRENLKHLPKMQDLPRSELSLVLSDALPHMTPTLIPPPNANKPCIPVKQDTSGTVAAAGTKSGRLSNAVKKKTAHKCGTHPTVKPDDDADQRKQTLAHGLGNTVKKGKKQHRKNDDDQSHALGNPLGSELSMVQSADPDEWICLFCQYQIFCHGWEAARRKGGYYKRQKQRLRRLHEPESRRSVEAGLTLMTDSDGISSAVLVDPILASESQPKIAQEGNHMV